MPEPTNPELNESAKKDQVTDLRELLELDEALQPFDAASEAFYAKLGERGELRVIPGTDRVL